MKKTSKCAFAALALVGAASAASAQTVSFSRSGGAVGNGSGGEFLSSFTGGGDLSGKSYLTFCLEQGENIALNGTPYTYTVDGLGYGANEGGNGTGGNDPVSLATAWLFSQWRNSADPLFQPTNANANRLQNAIWYLEGEITTANSGVQDLLDEVLAVFGAAGQAYDGFTYAMFGDNSVDAATSTFSFPGMRVINPVAPNGDLAQSQLIIIPLPTASGMALAGLALVGGIRRRK